MGPVDKCNKAQRRVLNRLWVNLDPELKQGLCEGDGIRCTEIASMLRNTPRDQRDNGSSSAPSQFGDQTLLRAVGFLKD